MAVDAEVVLEVFDVFGFEFEFAVFEDCFQDVVHGEIDLELVDGREVDFDGYVAVVAGPDVVYMRDNLRCVNTDSDTIPAQGIWLHLSDTSSLYDL